MPLVRKEIKNATVVSVTLNARDNIRLTLESVKNQRGAQVNHLVIDGGSHDGTIEIVREYPTAEIIVGKDAGIYDAMIKGARAATGDIMIFLNAGDMFYDDDVCKKVIDFCNANECDIVFGDILPVYLRAGDTHDHAAFVSGKPLDLSYVRNRRRLYDESIHHQSIFYRRDVFKHCTYKCPNPKATGEYNLILNAVFVQGFKVRYIKLPISRFALGGQSTGDFEAEWRRYTTARDILRDMYFKNGQDIPLDNEDEFHSA